MKSDDNKSFDVITLLLNEPRDVLAAASQGGYRCFTAVDDFRSYVSREILAEVEHDR
ncbi:MAG: hypothetical protein OXG58_00705 [Gemmatimonadetes bacterium]|nr:hypothetical protein [Gemmatimonadota bacterium]MCY3942434.1 hypothetical protein [Gemmatimonadota bacterium]